MQDTRQRTFSRRSGGRPGCPFVAFSKPRSPKRPRPEVRREPLARAIRRHVENPLSSRIIGSEFDEGYVVRVDRAGSCQTFELAFKQSDVDGGVALRGGLEVGAVYAAFFSGGSRLKAQS